jgi:uncharacterized phiE125 gp8 family phage protein
MIKYSKVIYEPQTEPVTTAEAKTHLRVTDSNDDAYITTLIKVARRMCERYAGVSFITQTRVVKLDYFPSCLPKEIELPFGPVIAMSGNDSATPTPNALGISYVDEDDDTQTLTLNTDFYLDSHSDIPRISPVDDWPTDVDDRINAITITYTAGYGAAANVPQEVKQAILMQVGSMYENRQDEGISTTGMLHWSSTALLDNIKVYYNARQD